MVEFTDDEERVVGEFARGIVDRRLTVPAVLLLESSKPVSFLGGQAMLMIEPFARAVVGSRWREAATILGDRDKLELFLRRIEGLEAERLEVSSHEPDPRKDP